VEGFIMTLRTAIPTNWKNLVTKLYLRPIRTKGDYNRAVQIARKLAARTDLNKDQTAYLEILTLLIDDYESKHVPIDTTQDPIQTLEFLLEANGLNSSDLGRILGQRQLGSKILKRKRQLSKVHIKKLGEYFSVEPGLFL
jgi:HTH-type transcriptional regulator/antitoxin HigA